MYNIHFTWNYSHKKKIAMSKSDKSAGNQVAYLSLHQVSKGLAPSHLKIFHSPCNPSNDIENFMPTLLILVLLKITNL